MFNKWKIVFLKDHKTLEDKGCYIISCNYNESLFDNYGFYSFQITFNGQLFSKFESIAVYYGDELQMKGILKRPAINPFAKEMTIEIYPITYFLSIQGMNTDKIYQEQNFTNHILAVLQDNLDNSKISILGEFKSISFDNFEFGIIPPMNINLIQQEMSEDQSERKPTAGIKLFNYIEKLANQNKVHITTLIYNNNTFLYFLDNASIVTKKILQNKIPIITYDTLTSENGFRIQFKEENIIEELILYSEGSFDNIEDFGTKTTYKVNLNKLFDNTGLMNDKSTLKSFFESSLNVKYRDYQKKETLLQQESMATIGKFIAENTLASGLAITISIRNLKADNDVPFLIGSFIDISDLFIKSKITTKIISAQSFIITGKTFKWSKDGFEQDIIIAPSFLLEN